MIVWLFGDFGLSSKKNARSSGEPSSKGLERHVVHGIALAEGPQRALVDPETNPENKHGTPTKMMENSELENYKTHSIFLLDSKIA